MRLSYVLAPAVLGCVSSAAFAQVGAPVTVTIHAGFTERQLSSSVRDGVHGQRLAFGPDNRITGWLKCSDPDCSPSSYTGSSPSSIRAAYAFKAEMDNLPDAKVTANINLGFGCFPLQSRLVIAASLTDLTIDLPTALRLALPGIGEMIQDFVRAQASSLTSGVTEALTDQVSFDALTLPTCPRLATTAAGDVIMDFTSGEECTSGDRREESCPSGQSGRGRTWACSNGWWQRTMNDCKAPPRLPPAANRRNYAVP
jgi:hypothetical protein